MWITRAYGALSKDKGESNYVSIFYNTILYQSYEDEIPVFNIEDGERIQPTNFNIYLLWILSVHYSLNKRIGLL